MQIKTTPWELLSLCTRKMLASFTVLLLGAGTGLGDVTGKVVVVNHRRGHQHPDFQSLGWAEAFTDILAELKLKALFLQLVTDTQNFMHVSGTIKAYTYTCVLRVEHLSCRSPRPAWQSIPSWINHTQSSVDNHEHAAWFPGRPWSTAYGQNEATWWCPPK